MEEGSLITFLRRSPSLMKVVFPREADKVILAEEVKELMTFEDRRDSEQNERTAQFYEFYIDELEAGVKGYIYIYIYQNNLSVNVLFLHASHHYPKKY